LNGKPTTAATAARPPHLAASFLHDGKVLSDWLPKKKRPLPARIARVLLRRTFQGCDAQLAETAKIVSIHIDTRP
jgi:hypothetical protein